MASHFIPRRTDRNEDGSPVTRAFTSSQADRAVAFLADALLEAEVSIDTVLDYEETDWDALCAARSREEWEGLITDAIASRIVCLMLEDQIARVASEKVIPPRVQIQRDPQSVGAVKGETVACCPECLSVAISCVAFEGGVDRESGYLDAGEQFVCRDCGARGDAADVAWTALENAALPSTVTDTRLHLAALGRMWDAAGLSFVEKLNRKQARCPHLKTDPGGNCYECGKRGAAAGANVSQDVLKVHPHDYGVRSSDITTAQGDRPSVDSQEGGCEQEAA